MTDLPSEQSPATPSSETAISCPGPPANDPDFDYPQILLHTSFSSLLSHSFPSTVSSSPPSSTPIMEDGPRSSLSESWASLSNSEFNTDDDLHSENTDVGSLIDANDSEDVHSIDEGALTEDDDEDDESYESGSPAGIEDSIPDIAGSSEPALNLSTHTIHNDTTVPQSQDLESIEFDEPDHWPEVGHIDVKHTLKVFQDDEAELLRDSLPLRGVQCQLVGTIRMTMSKHGLPLHQPFRVLYNGLTTAMDLRGDILQTLAVALVASGDSGSYYRNLESSRYHVIPSAFGPGASSDHATMVPIQTQLIVDECVGAASLEDSSGQEQIILSLKNRDIIHSRWDGIWQNVQERRRWIRPDVAVLLVNNDTDSANQRQTTRLIHECMLRHNVPTLVIIDDSGWSPNHARGDALGLDPQGLHRCIETKTTTPSASRVVRRLPVDLETFTNLDPEQLNKHLACLNDIAQSRIATISENVSFVAGKPRQARQGETLNDVEKNMSKSFMVQNPTFDFGLLLQILRENMVTVAIVVVFMAWFLALSMSRGGSGIQFSPPPGVSVPGVPITEPLTTTLPVSPLTKASTAVKSLPTAIPTVRTQTDLARLLADPFVDLVNKSDKFQVEIIGDCHIVVKTPKTILQRRREPKIRLQVLRGTDQLDTQVSKLFEGVYAVKLERDKAYGLLNLTILMSQPSINETVELDFGSPWLKMASWDKAGQNLLARVLNEVHLAPVRSLVELVNEKSWVHQHLSRMRLVSEKAQNLRKASARVLDVLYEFVDNVKQHGADTMARSNLTQEAMREKLEVAHNRFQAVIASSEAVTAKARAYSEATMASFKEYTGSIRRSLHEVEIPDLRTKMATKLAEGMRSHTLSKAQDRAQKIIRDTADKLDRHRKTRKAGKKNRVCGRRGR